MNTELNNVIQVEFGRRKMNSQAHSIAGYLLFALRIPDGRQLVYAIGHGDEKSNLEAVSAWVRERLADCGSLTREEWAIKLKRELEDTFIE